MASNQYDASLIGCADMNELYVTLMGKERMKPRRQAIGLQRSVPRGDKRRGMPTFECEILESKTLAKLARSFSYI